MPVSSSDGLCLAQQIAEIKAERLMRPNALQQGEFP
jgi:hypothetical protein